MRRLDVDCTYLCGMLFLSEDKTKQPERTDKMVKEIIEKLKKENGIDEENIRRALFNFIIPDRVPVPFAVLEMARKKMNLSSIGVFLTAWMLEYYLLEDEADKIEIRENEFVIRDYSLKDFGIKPGDIVLYNPEKTDETVYFSAVDIDGCVFPADLNDDEEDPDKYCVCTNGAYFDFTVYKKKVNVLGEIIGWRKADETKYRPFIEE